MKGRIGSNLPHALVVHKGAPPHLITPRRAQSLAFYWERVGAFVRFQQVHHPGMEGQPYLTAPLVVIGERNGFRVYLVQTPD